MIKIKCELEGFKEVQEMFSKELMRKTLRSALDKSATEVKKEIVEEVSSSYNIAPKDVRDTINVQRTTQGSLEANLNIKGKRLSLLYFKARQAPFGVIANVKKAGVSFYKSAFIVDKWGKAMRRRGRKRLPIQHMAGPSVPQMVNTEGIMKKIEAKVPEIINRKFSEEVDRRMRTKQ